MGRGYWDTSVYDARGAAKAAAGRSTFEYSDDTHSRPADQWKAHPSVDPKGVNTLGSKVRESRDSAEHPESLPIAVVFDVTGSMHDIPVVLQKKLKELDGLIRRKGYVEHPQILFGAIGDAFADRVPLQMGQFESDNRMDEQLENIFLEGGGGGGNHESYDLAAYFLARHTELDSVDKRGKKGYAFFIGDERLYAKVSSRAVQKVIGDALQEDIPTEQIFAELKEKFEVFFLFARQGSYQPEQVLPEKAGARGYGGYDLDSMGWRKVLDQNALVLDDAEAVCETIALTIGLSEGAIDLDEGVDHLKEVGADAKAIKAASSALARVAPKSAVAKTTGSLPGLSSTGGSSTRRL